MQPTPTRTKSQNMSRSRSNALRPAARWRISSSASGGLDQASSLRKQDPYAAALVLKDAVRRPWRHRTAGGYGSLLSQGRQLCMFAHFASRHRGPSQHGDMGRVRAGDAFGTDKAKRRQVEPREQVLARPQKDWRNGEMKFVEQTCLQILPDDRNAAADANVLAAGDLCRPRQRGLDAIGHEVKDGAALHLDRRARMMGQDEHRHVVRRIVSPPALPGMVGPLAADRAEHVSSHDPCAHIFHRLSGEVIVGVGRSPLLADHFVKHPRLEQPVWQLHAANTKLMLQVLIWTRPESVE